MDEETSGSIRLGSPLRPLLTYGVPYIGAGVWAFAKFPSRLRWTNDIFARVFGLAAPFYEDLTHVEGYGEALEAAIEALERPPVRVLDLCCGTGFAARRIQHHFPDADVVGIDLSPEMVLMARRESDEEGFDIEFEVGDASDLEFDDESFDLVVSENAPPYPEETMRVLAPGGTALTVWSFGGPWIGLAWPALSKRFRRVGALHADGHRAGPGFYGVAEKSGVRRRRRPRTDRPAPPDGRSGGRAAPTSPRIPAPARTGPAVPPLPPVRSPSASARAREAAPSMPIATEPPSAEATVRGTASRGRAGRPVEGTTVSERSGVNRSAASRAPRRPGTSPPAAKASAVKTPAVKTSATKAPAAKASGVKAPTAKTPAAKTPAAKTSSRKTSSRKTSAAETTPANAPAANVSGGRTPTAKAPAAAPAAKASGGKAPAAKRSVATAPVAKGSIAGVPGGNGPAVSSRRPARSGRAAAAPSDAAPD